MLIKLLEHSEMLYKPTNDRLDKELSYAIALDSKATLDPVSPNPHIPL